MNSRKSRRKVSSVRSRDSRPTIGLLSEAGTPYHNALWAGVAGAASELDVNLIFYAGGHIGAPEHDLYVQHNILYDLVAAEKVDGLLICGTLGNYVTTEEFQGFVDRYRPLPMVSVLRTPGLPHVIGDSEKGMRDLVTHFIEVHGYRRIAFICGPEGSVEAAMRYRAYVDALAEHDLSLDLDLVAPGAFAYETGIDAIRLLLDERKVEFEAVVAANDWMAFGALEVLEERGMRVPEDIALGGFDDTREAMASRPALTTVRQPIHELGRAGVEVLLKLLAGEPVPEQTMLPTKLVVRQSCGCSDPVVAHAAVGSWKRKRESLQGAVAVQREAILSEMVQAVEGPALVFSSKWADRLLDAFLEEMSPGSAASKPSLQGPFLLALSDVLQQVTAVGGQVSDWQTVISVMRRCLLPYLTNVAVLARAEDTFSQGRVMIGRMAQWNWARQGVEDTQQAEELGYLSGDLVAAVGTEQILDVLTHRLPRLGFSAFYLSLYDEQKRPSEWSRLALAYDSGGRVEMDADGRRFPTRQLIPDELFPQERRYTWAVESLELRENQFGYIVFEGSQDGGIYGILARQISSALQGALLVRRIQERSAELARQQYILDTFMGNVPDSIYFKDLESRFTRMNKALARHFELGDPAEGVGKSDYDFFPEDQAQPKYEQEQEIIRTGEPILNLEEPDGIEHWALTTKMPLRDERGEIIGTFGISRDITAMKQAQAALEQAYAEVERQVAERTVDLKREQEESARLQQEVIEAQQRAIQELSTPIIPVLEGVIVMPLIGSIDTLRARDVTRSLLAGIREHRAKVVILDITGVPIVDSGVAAYLNKTIQAARLKGARTIVTGVSDAVAETIVDLGIDWGGIETLSDLRTGLRTALRGAERRVG
jgi:PAS domain S-box-containing protein